MSRASIGEYVVTKKLGSGSFAVVYKGYHKVTKVPVAIKAMSLAKLNAKLLANLEMEIAIMRQIDHPNVVKLYEIKKTEKHMYLMLEFCAGGDLQQYMRRRQHEKKLAARETAVGPVTLSEPVARHFLHELAMGMKCLWTHNLIHRDLKPQNLLLTDDSPTASLKIADFGFARHLAATSMAETLCGSPLYMAPEILKFQKYDAKADLWSVGTILYEMVVGKPPYGGANHVQLLANIERTELRFPADATVSEACVGLLRGLLHRRPENRMGFDDFFQHPVVGLGDDADGDDSVMVAVEASDGFQSLGMTTSIREEDENEEKHAESQVREGRGIKSHAVGGDLQSYNEGGDANHYSAYMSPSKERSVHDYQDGESRSGGLTPTRALPSPSMRSSRSGNMEVMQTAFGSTSSTGTSSTQLGNAALRRSARLGRSRRATSSGAIRVTTTSPKLSPQMSPSVLPTPSPRINPFKELSGSSSPPLVAAGAGAFVSATGDTTDGTNGSSVSNNSGSQRATRTHTSIVQQKHPTNHSLDSSGEYVLVESGLEKTPGKLGTIKGNEAPTGTYFNTHVGDAGKFTSSGLKAAAAVQNRSGNTDYGQFSDEYAQHLVEIITLRTQAIAPIADHLWMICSSSVSSSSMSPEGGATVGSAAYLNSMVSLSSSMSASGHALVGVSASSGVLRGNASNTHEKKQQYVCAAQALTLYVTCMRMIQHALTYVRQDPMALKSSTSPSKPSFSTNTAPWSAASRKMSLAFLVEQLNSYLDRAERCKKFMSQYLSDSDDGLAEELRGFAVSQEELLYTHALRLGKEGAVKEVLGQTRPAYELYLRAMLLLESLLAVEGPSSLDTRQSTPQDPQSHVQTKATMTIDDQKRVSGFVKALDERLKVVAQSTPDGFFDGSNTLAGESPPLFPQPENPSSLSSEQASAVTMSTL